MNPLSRSQISTHTYRDPMTTSIDYDRSREEVCHHRSSSFIVLAGRCFPTHSYGLFVKQTIRTRLNIAHNNHMFVSRRSRVRL